MYSIEPGELDSEDRETLEAFLIPVRRALDAVNEQIERLSTG
jgi:hypothetical protein